MRGNGLEASLLLLTLPPLFDHFGGGNEQRLRYGKAVCRLIKKSKLVARQAYLARRRELGGGGAIGNAPCSPKTMISVVPCSVLIT
jgi:hypothetical protein